MPCKEGGRERKLGEQQQNGRKATTVSHPEHMGRVTNTFTIQHCLWTGTTIRRNETEEQKYVSLHTGKE